MIWPWIADPRAAVNKGQSLFCTKIHEIVLGSFCSSTTTKSCIHFRVNGEDGLPSSLEFSTLLAMMAVALTRFLHLLFHSNGIWPWAWLDEREWVHRFGLILGREIGNLQNYPFFELSEFAYFLPMNVNLIPFFCIAWICTIFSSIWNLWGSGNLGSD
jgi:hypothetical protein